MSAIALGTLAVGAYSAYQNNKKANDAETLQRNAYGAELANAGNLQGQEARTYGPLEQQLVQQASSDQPMYYGAMSGAINRNVDAGERSLATQMAARGMGGQGLQAGATAGMEMGRAGELSQAFNTGLQARTQLGMNVLQRYNPAQDVSLTNQAYNQMGAYGGREQNYYSNAAQQGWGEVGQGLQALNQNRLLNQGTPPPSTPTGPAAPTSMPQSNMATPMGSSLGPVPTPPMGLGPVPSGWGDQTGTATWNGTRLVPSGTVATRVG